MASFKAAEGFIYNWASKDGELKPANGLFHGIISPRGNFLPKTNRYHLYVSLAFPWAHRTLVVRNLKGLDKVISVSMVQYNMGPQGWHFSTDETPGCSPDTVTGAKLLRELYFSVDPECKGRFTVHVLWCKRTNIL
jgi:glutathionyl-hydroquinone reductase